MDALLLANPYASGTTRATVAQVRQILATQSRVTVRTTEGAGHAEQIGRSAAAQGFDIAIALGGDGTAHELINGVLGGSAPPPAIAALPGGSASVFARALGLGHAPIPAAHQLAAAIGTGRRRSISLVRVAFTRGHGGGERHRYVIFAAGLGLDAATIRAMDRRRDRGNAAGPAQYMMLAWREYLRARRRPEELTVELPDGTRHEVGALFVCNTNPWTYVGPMPVVTNPGCGFHSGLGVFGLHSMGLFTSLRLLPQILRSGASPQGSALLRRDSEQWVTVRSARPARFQIDGEFLGEFTQLHFESIASAIEVVA